MAPLAIILVLAAAPSLSVTLETSSGTDVGNGKIIATSDTSIVITPTEVRQSSEGTNKGKKSARVEKPKPLVPASRDAIAALLPRLPMQSASFSISPYVDDEGWNSSRLVLVREGTTTTFELVQGKQAPPIPPGLDELRKLIAAALKG